jgi:Ribulose-5-phosphate 4-epimerase and related epimerases and aldolases
VPNTLAEARQELALANQIVANEGIIDAFGHVSMRHPDDPSRYLLSRSRAPELVTPDDFIEYDLESQPLRDPGVGQYSERVIHGEIYKARPEVNSVCHHHCPAFMPLLATGTDYMPIFHLGAVGAYGRLSGISATNSATPTCWWSGRRRVLRWLAHWASIGWC